MPKKKVKYSADPNDRMKNKDGTVKRFRNERFVGDIVVPSYDYYCGWYVRDPLTGRSRYEVARGERVVEALVGPHFVKLEGIEKPVGIGSTRVKRKVY
jgi:hypothetical protein